MTIDVRVFDTFYDLDPVFDYSSCQMALIASTYTFDHTDASFTTDIQPDESTGSGYSQVTGVYINRDASTAYPVLKYTLTASGSGIPTFPTLTTTDYQYVCIFDSSDRPLFLIGDSGSGPLTLTAQALAVGGVLLELTGPTGG